MSKVVSKSSKEGEFREVVEQTVTVSNFVKKWAGKFKREEEKEHSDEEGEEGEEGRGGGKGGRNRNGRFAVAPMVRVSGIITLLSQHYKYASSFC